MNELDIDADWWFPNNDLKFNGRLIFSQRDGGRLMLVGSQEPFILLDANSGQTDSIEQANSDKTCKRNTRQKLILGETKDREQITIIYTLEPSTTSVIKNQYSYVERSYEIDFIFIGTHFETVDDIKFENILVEYSNLPSWMTNSEMIGSTILKPNKSENKYTMEHRFGKRIDVFVDNRCSIQFLSYPDIRIDFATRNKVSNLPYVLISSIGKQTLEEYIELKNILQDFFNLINVSEVGTLRMIAEHKITDEQHEFIEKVQIFYQSSVSEKMHKKVISPHSLRIDNLDDKFAQTLKKWFELKNRIGATYDLYFGVMYNSDLYLTNRFLMLAGAAEIYMGIVSEIYMGIVSDVELQKKIERIDRIVKALSASDLNESDKDWVVTSLKGMKSLYFREKMERVYDAYSELLPKLSYVIGTRQEFARTITEYRNRLTHANVNYDDLDNETLFWLYKDLQLLLSLCIVTELGFTKNEMEDIYFVR
jgi:hypothetical protein